MGIVLFLWLLYVFFFSITLFVVSACEWAEKCALKQMTDWVANFVYWFLWLIVYVCDCVDVVWVCLVFVMFIDCAMTGWENWDCGFFCEMCIYICIWMCLHMCMCVYAWCVCLRVYVSIWCLKCEMVNGVGVGFSRSYFLFERSFCWIWYVLWLDCLGLPMMWCMCFVVFSCVRSARLDSASWKLVFDVGWSVRWIVWTCWTSSMVMTGSGALFGCCEFVDLLWDMRCCVFATGTGAHTKYEVPMVVWGENWMSAMC